MNGHYKLNGYYSCLGGQDDEELYIEITPRDIPADLYAFWFLPSWGTVMSDDPRYRQWGKGNFPQPRRIPVRRRKRKKK